MTPVVCAQGEALRIGGYLKSFFTALDRPTPGEETEVAARLSVRLNLSWQPNDWFSALAAYGLSPQARSGESGLQASHLPKPGPLSYRLRDWRARFYPSPRDTVSSFSLFNNLDRALVSIYWEDADITVGRQPVAFGSARRLNPSDVIAPFTYEAIDKEERTGVDAFRIRGRPGGALEVDAGWVFGRNFKTAESAGFLRTGFYVKSTDLWALAMVFRKKLLFGLDLSRSIGGAGSWVEAAYTLAAEAEGGDYLRLSAGLDHYLFQGTYGFVEYHFNGAGSGEPQTYFSLLNDFAHSEGAVFLFARHYLALGIHREVTPLVVIATEALINLNDRSVLFAPSLERSLSEDLSLRCGAFVKLGAGLERALEARSEFGRYPNLVFVSIQAYF